MKPEEIKDKEKLESYKAEFIQSMDDDLNTADGISDIFELASHINQTANENSSKEYLQAAFDIFSELTGVLNIIQKHASVDEEKINHLIEQRDQAKRNKDFAQADQIRDELKDMGIELLDTRAGTTWKEIQ